MRAERYTPEHRATWNDFVARSKNATFLFDRGYMEYHADRFEDASLLVFEGERPVALFPANRAGHEWASHGGLTYGGLLLAEDVTIGEALDAFRAVLRTAADEGAATITYKTIPTIYHAIPAEEDRHALFRADARLVRRDVWSVVELARAPRLQERRRRSVRKAERAGVRVERSARWAEFWEILSENLMRRYGVRPVHSLDEIELLARRFPENIVLTAAYAGERMVGGVVTYISGRVVHVQYPGVSEEGMELGALDAVHAHLMTAHASTHRYYDFGASTEEGGRKLNRGLVEYKEGFGARSVTHDFYLVDVTRALGQLND